MSQIPNSDFDFSNAYDDEIIAHVVSMIPLIADRLNAILPCKPDDIKCGYSDFDTDTQQIFLTIATEQFTIDRNLDPVREIATPGNFSLNRKYRNKGLGKKLMFAHLQGLQDIGLSGCDIYAGSSNGAYVWFKFGFEFTRNGSMQNSDNLNLRTHLIKKFFHISRLEEFNQLAYPTSSSELKSLIEFRTSLTSLRPESQQEFIEYLGAQTSEYDHDLVKEFLNDSLNNIIEKYKFFSLNDFPLGEFIIQGLPWRGHFDFKNEQQWQTARAATFPEL